MSGNNQYTAAEFIEAIKGEGRWAKYTEKGDRLVTGCFGIISKVADRVGASWHTAKKYCTRETTPFVTVAKAFEEEHERALDYSESQMYKQIQDGDGAMIRYHLSTQGKSRGYTERSEVTGAGGGPVQVQSIERALERAYGDDDPTD